MGCQTTFVILLVLIHFGQNDGENEICGQSIQLTGAMKTKDISITEDKACLFSITNSDPNFNIGLRFKSVEFGEDKACKHRYVQLGKDKEKLTTEPKYCMSPESTILVVDGKALWVQYHTESEQGTLHKEKSVINFAATVELLSKEPDLCSEEILLTTDETKLISRTDKRLLRDKDCVIQVFSHDEGYNIAFKLTKVKLEDDAKECTKNYVKYAGDRNALLRASLYCKEPPPEEYRTDGSTLHVAYHAGLDLTYSVGFEAAIRRVVNLCKEKITLTDESSISIIRMGSMLTLDKNCIVTVTSTAKDSQISIQFRKLQFKKSGEKCDTDYVKFGANEQELGTANKYCDLPSPSEQVIADNTLLIAYHASTDDVASGGFDAIVKRVISSSLSTLSASFLLVTTMLYLALNRSL